MQIFIFFSFEGANFSETNEGKYFLLGTFHWLNPTSSVLYSYIRFQNQQIANEGPEYLLEKKLSSSIQFPSLSTLSTGHLQPVLLAKHRYCLQKGPITLLFPILINTFITSWSLLQTHLFTPVPVYMWVPAYAKDECMETKGWHQMSSCIALYPSCVCMVGGYLYVLVSICVLSHGEEHLHMCAHMCS